MNLSAMVQHPKQHAFTSMRCRYGAYIGGYGSMKTRALAQLATLQTFTLRGMRGLIGAPTWPQFSGTTMESLFELWEELGIREGRHYLYERTAKKISNPDLDSQFFMRAMREKFKLQGLNLNWFGCDEIEGLDDPTYKLLKTRLRAPLVDPAACYAGRFVGNPPAGNTWFIRDFYRAETKKPGHEYITASSLENFFLDDETLHELEHNVFVKGSPMWRRYIGGELDVQAEGLIYDEFNKDLHCISENDVPWGKIVHWPCGLDFGHVHPFCYLEICRDSDDRYYIVGEHYEAGKLMEHHASVIKRRRHMPGVIYRDHAAQEAAELTKLGVNTVPAWKAEKNIAIYNVKRAMLDGDDGPHLFIVKDKCPNLVAEIEGYRWKSATGLQREAPEEPVDKDDHACDAMLYGIGSDMHSRGKIVKSFTSMTSRSRVDISSLAPIPQQPVPIATAQELIGKNEAQRERAKRALQRARRGGRMEL